MLVLIDFIQKTRGSTMMVGEKTVLVRLPAVYQCTRGHNLETTLNDLDHSHAVTCKPALAPKSYYHL